MRLLSKRVGQHVLYSAWLIIARRPSCPVVGLDCTSHGLCARSWQWPVWVPQALCCVTVQQNQTGQSYASCSIHAILLPALPVGLPVKMALGSRMLTISDGCWDLVGSAAVHANVVADIISDVPDAQRQAPKDQSWGLRFAAGRMALA